MSATHLELMQPKPTPALCRLFHGIACAVCGVDWPALDFLVLGERMSRCGQLKELGALVEARRALQGTLRTLLPRVDSSTSRL